MMRGLENRGELVAELRGGAGGVHGAQDFFPQASAHRQQRIIGLVPFLIFGNGAEAGAFQVTIYFTLIFCEALPQLAQLVGALREHNFTHDVFHVGIRK